jgi:pyridoxine/pyridoxamine 5'-phosphate oxidase
MYIKNRRYSNKIKAFGSHQSSCLTESEVLRNRLLFIYLTVRLPENPSKSKSPVS